MTLKQYLDNPDRTASLIAATAGVSVSTITRASEGITIPSRDLMQKIFDATEGAVTPNDFYGLAA